MKSHFQVLKTYLQTVFTWEHTICRLIAAWCILVACNLSREGNFFDVTFAQNTSLGLMLLWAALLFALFSLVNYLLPGLETDSWTMFGAATACVIRWLVKYKYYQNGMQFLLAVIVVYSLFAVYFVNKNKRLWHHWDPGKRTVWIVVMLCGIICAAVIAAITCLRHKVFQTFNFDMGLFTNMFHYMKETGLPLSTSERDVLMSHFAVHISPIFYLILPVYCIFPSVFTLQIAQAVILASGVVPAMLLCRQFRLSGKMTILITALYAFYPAVSTGCFYDLHENCFLPPLLLWMFYFFEKEKDLPMYLSAALTLMVKEDAAVYVFLFAVYVLISRKKYVQGCILIAGSLAYFAAAMLILNETAAYYRELYAGASPNPAIAGPMINRFDNLMADKTAGLAGVVKTALVNPGYLMTQLFTTNEKTWEKIAYVLQMLLPLGFLPFCSGKPSRYLLVAPILLNLLTDYPYQYDITFQYHFGITAFLIYAAAVNLPDMKRPQKRTLLSIAAVACCCMYLGLVIPRLQLYREQWEMQEAVFREAEAVLDGIPKEASVASTHSLVPHLADRDEIYGVAYHGNEGDVDYVIYDTRYAVDQEQYQAYLDQGYVVQTVTEMITVLEKGN